eukprot:4791336-Amphidinium_carterae.1
MHGEIGEIQGLDCISGKREIKVPYRGLQIPLTVNSCLDEATVRVRTALRACASSKKTLSQLPGECGLADAPEREFKMAAFLHVKAQHARTHLRKLLAQESPEDRDGEKVL